MRNILIRLAIKYNGDYFRIQKAITAKEKVDRNIELQKAITILDEEYPEELLELRYPPYVLFYEGNIELLKRRKCSVVGSRNPSAYGGEATRQVVDCLKDKYVIVSGMAKGIDRLAHCEAINTIGVLGNGVNITYPYSNRDIYRYMREKQLLISEYPADVKPEKYHFPFRNRIIAALGEKIIVTQAGLKSGTMLTVNEALNLNREIYVVPYRLTDKEGAGCNKLISQGANVVQWAESKNN